MRHSVGRLDLETTDRRGRLLKRRYIFVNGRKRRLISAFDWLGDRLYSSAREVDISSRQFLNILLISLDLLGDNVIATPMVEALKRRYPECRLTVLVNERFKDIFTGNSFVDDVIGFDTPWFPRRYRKTSFRELKRLGKELSGKKFDLAIDPRGDLRHNLIMRLAGIPARVGYGVAGGGFLLTREVLYRFKGHRVERNFRVLEPLGIKVNNKPALKVYPSKKHGEEIAKELLSDVGDEPGERTNEQSRRKIIIIHPFASCQAKQWPEERFAEVAGWAKIKRGCTVVLIGSAGEKSALESIASMTAREEIVRPQLFAGRPLKDLIDLLSVCDLFIGGDSGPLQIVTALGRPAVVLYPGENDPAIWGPYGGNNIVLRKEVSCKLCGKTECVDNICMTSITVEEVKEASRQLLPKDGENREGSRVAGFDGDAACGTT